MFTICTTRLVYYTPLVKPFAITIKGKRGNLVGKEGRKGKRESRREREGEGVRKGMIEEERTRGRNGRKIDF